MCRLSVGLRLIAFMQGNLLAKRIEEKLDFRFNRVCAVHQHRTTVTLIFGFFSYITSHHTNDIFVSFYMLSSKNDPFRPLNTFSRRFNVTKNLSENQYSTIPKNEKKMNEICMRIIVSSSNLNTHEKMILVERQAYTQFRPISYSVEANWCEDENHSLYLPVVYGVQNVRRTPSLHDMNMTPTRPQTRYPFFHEQAFTCNCTTK